MRRNRNEATSRNVIMNMRFLRAALYLSAFSLLAAQQTPPAGEPIRLTVQVVLAPVTVLNRDGSYVNGLEPQHFHLLDNGKPQSISVDVAFQPISLAKRSTSGDKPLWIIGRSAQWLPDSAMAWTKPWRTHLKRPMALLSATPSESRTNLRGCTD